MYILLFIKLIITASNHPVIWSGKNDLPVCGKIDGKPREEFVGHHYSGDKQLKYLISTIFSINVLLSIPSISVFGYEVH
jgi:hypothetical protein